MTSRGQGDIVRRARQAARLTQTNVADAASVSLSTVKRVERGGSISAENLRSICAALSIDLAALPLPDPEPALPASPPRPSIEGIGLDDTAQAVIDGSGPILAAGRCRADLWLRQDGRRAPEADRRRRELRGRLGCALSAIAAVAVMGAATFYLGGWCLLLRHQPSPAIVGLLAVAVVSLLTILVLSSRMSLRADHEGRAMASDLQVALSRAGAATGTAYVGLVERDGLGRAVVIPWEDATVAVRSAGGIASLRIEGAGHSHEVEGLEGDCPLIREASARAARVDTLPLAFAAPDLPRIGNPWRRRPVEYVRRLAPGLSRSRTDDTVSILEPGGRPLVTLTLRPDRLGVEAAVPMTLVAGLAPRTYRIDPGGRRWIRIAASQTFSLVRDAPVDPERLGRAWAVDEPGFVMSGQHWVEARTSPMETVLHMISNMWGQGAALLGAMFVTTVLVIQFHAVLAEPVIRELRAKGMGLDAAREAASPVVGAVDRYLREPVR